MTGKRQRIDSRTVAAVTSEKEALTLDGQAARGMGRPADQLISASLRREAHKALTPDAPVERGAGGEAVPEQRHLDALQAGAESSLAADALRDTMEAPDVVHLDASAHRLALLERTNALALGLDMADSLEVANSLERAMLHQMGTLHSLAMTFAARTQDCAYGPIDKDDDANLRATRLANTTARLTKTFGEMATALAKLRTGGRQEVVVQHVNVGSGGRAIVAGSVGGKGQAGATGGGRDEK